MIDRDEGKTRFFDGLRVAREHLDNLQDTLLAGIIQLRQCVGTGKVCFGFKVQTAGAGTVHVSAGVAFDRQGRPLILTAAREIPANVSPGQSAFVVALYVLRSSLPVDGVPTILTNDIKLEARATPPPYQDDAVVFAQLLGRTDGFDIVQKGEWYLAPLDHRHSGQFLDDDARGFRFDGQPIGLGPPRFDSGFLTVGPGQDLRLAHGLNTVNLLVQVQSRKDGVISGQGFGTSYWYELPGAQEIRLRRTPDAEGSLELRAMLWPFDNSAAGPVLPVANAGEDQVVELGASFTLDASRSTAFGGRKLINFVWTQLS
jgi:hypothetical protein